MNSIDKHPASGSLATNDLLERARQLSAPAPQASAPAVETDALDGFDAVAYHRQMVTTQLRNVVVKEILELLELDPADYDDIVSFQQDDVEWETYLTWAMVDVAWCFADEMSRLEDVSDYLTEIGELVPKGGFSFAAHDFPDLRRVLAMTILAREDLRWDSKIYLEVSARMLAVLMGLVAGHPRRMLTLGPDMVSRLAHEMARWARKPATLDVFYAGEGDDIDRTWVVPKDGEIIARAAYFLEEIHRENFRQMAQNRNA